MCFEILRSLRSSGVPCGAGKGILTPAVMIDSLAAKGRIELVHYKDMTMALDPNGASPYASVQAMAPVGEGNIDWVSVDKAVENAGIKYCFVEQDNCYGADPFECMAKSFKNMQARGL